ncbi:hypothetical protein MML48_2g00005660 [Holotrichia oblita]|uniref:Uncharacterized protein n=1 Tax=Holotrichia oblita TaxID=644536 RepID=A0ACB9TLP6_HOLOL|nr:hypothetical protein MML48_2g00005660 [Holotrichia oblita]
MTVYQAVYLQVLIYGAENWILDERQTKRVQSSEMKYLRKTLGARRTDKKRNDDIRQMLTTKSLRTKVEEKKFKWRGHLIRMNETRQVKREWETFKGRFRKIMDLADNISSDSTAQDSLDVLERRLYTDGHRSRSKLNAWLVESGVPLEAANMVINHRKRKRVDIEDI